MVPRDQQAGTAGTGATVAPQDSEVLQRRLEGLADVLGVSKAAGSATGPPGAASTSEDPLMEGALRLAQRARQFSTLVENSPDIFARVDRELRHLYVSPAIERYTGAAPASFLGKTNAELGMPPELCAEWAVAFDKVFSTGEVGNVKFAFESLEGPKVFISRLMPEFDAAGEVESVLSIAVDVTEQENINQALLESQARLREADSMKDEFLATLAHELRNPLAPIRNALEIMRITREPQAHASARNVIERQLRQMIHLVDDLLDISRISQRKLELRREPADLHFIAQAAVETSRPLIDAARHELKVSLPPANSLFVHGDVTRLCQVFSNLLNNAAKYTPRGGVIEFSVEREADRALVTVRDSGIGIPHEMLGRVFDMFTQVEGADATPQGGLGIGLALVRQLVEMHEGDVVAHSAGPNLGSVFTVRLPLSQSPGTTPSQDDSAAFGSAPQAGVRVLVVDDNVDSAQTMALILDAAGYHTAVAHDGLTAAQMAQSFAPAVAILDIGLPLMSGLEVAQSIRRQPGGADMLLVALSGWGQDTDQRKSREAGFDHHFVKPVDLDVLAQVVASGKSGPVEPGRS